MEFHHLLSSAAILASRRTSRIQRNVKLPKLLSSQTWLAPNNSEAKSPFHLPTILQNHPSPCRMVALTALANSKLSEELLKHIVSTLSVPGDLRALSMTSRNLHRITLQHLFAHVDFRLRSRYPNRQNTFMPSDVRSQEESAKFCSFAVLTLQRPDQACFSSEFLHASRLRQPTRIGG